MAGFEALGFPVATGFIDIMCCDPGFATGGYGFLRLSSDASEITLLAHGEIKTAPSDSTVERVRQIAARLQELCDAHAPSVVAFEAYTNYGRVFWLGVQCLHSIGALIAVAGARGCPVFAYGAKDTKRSIGVTDGTKSSVKARVAELLGLPKPLRSEHASDALCVGLAHAATLGFDAKRSVLRSANDNARATKVRARRAVARPS